MPTNEIIFFLFWWCPFVRVTPANRFNHCCFACHMLEMADEWTRWKRYQDTPLMQWYCINMHIILIIIDHHRPPMCHHRTMVLFDIHYSHHGLFSCSSYFVRDGTGFVLSTLWDPLIILLLLLLTKWYEIHAPAFNIVRMPWCGIWSQILGFNMFTISTWSLLFWGYMDRCAVQFWDQFNDNLIDLHHI